MKKDKERITILFEGQKLLCCDDGEYYTIKNYVNKFCFADWKNRGHCLDIYDFLEAIDYASIASDAQWHLDSFLTLIELVLNFWDLAEKKLHTENSTTRSHSNFYHLKELMEDCLSNYNQKAYYFEDEERVIVAEDKAEVTSVAEIVPIDLAMEIVRYNHRTLRRNIEAKKTILLKMGSDIEAKRSDLERVNRPLASDIFFMLNNMDIRHNNSTPTDPSKYKKFVADMDAKTLEYWYDELYQMILLANLELDQVDRTESVKQLKKDMENVKIG
jgi:hypothetical protein